jgi:hypothetical protein
MQGRLVRSRPTNPSARAIADMLSSLVRKAVLGMMAMHRLQDSVGQSASARAAEDEKNKLRGEVAQYKKEAEEVSILPRRQGGCQGRS